MEKIIAVSLVYFMKLNDDDIAIKNVICQVENGTTIEDAIQYAKESYAEECAPYEFVNGCATEIEIKSK